MKNISVGAWPASLLAALALALPATAAAGTADYVALGDSYAAGPGIPPPGDPAGCQKSGANYPHLAAPRLGMTLADASCSGARTYYMTATQPQGPNPPQFNSLRSDTRVVTLSIGANDIDFMGVVNDCATSTTTPIGSPCRSKYVSGGNDQVSGRIASAAPNVGAAIQGIHSRSPGARVFVLNYPAIFPDSVGQCWPAMPVADGDVAWLRDKEKELNQMLANQAAANGATLIDWYTASIGHDACEPPGDKWVEGTVAMSPAAALHPNLAGMAVASQLVVSAAQG